MSSTSSTLNALLIGVIVVAIMFVGREVLIPLALSGILSFMLAPPVMALQRLRLPRPLAVMIVVLIAFGAVFALGRVLANQVTDLAQDLPKYQQTISKKIESLRSGGGGGATLERAQVVLRQLDREIEESQAKSGQKEAAAPAATPAPGSRLIPVEVHEPSGGPLQTLITLINPLLGPLATTMLIVIFIIFILIAREDLRDRLIRLVGATDIPHMTAALDDAGHRLSHLFLTQLAINSGFGAAIGLGLWWIGVPSAFIWGVLAGILRFVPFVGPVLGLVFPLVLAVAVGSGWSMALVDDRSVRWTRRRDRTGHRARVRRAHDGSHPGRHRRRGDVLGMDLGTGRACTGDAVDRHPGCARPSRRGAKILRYSTRRRAGADGFAGPLSARVGA